MRHIYLDIDGVLATNRTYRAWSRAGRPSGFRSGWVDLIDPTRMDLLNEFGRQIAAGVVISSNWRFACPYQVEEVLRAAGLTLPILGQTRVLEGVPASHLRGYEINAHIVASGVPLSEVVVFDDDRAAARSPEDSPVRHGSRVIITPETSTGRWGCSLPCRR